MAFLPKIVRLLFRLILMLAIVWNISFLYKHYFLSVQPYAHQSVVAGSTDPNTESSPTIQPLKWAIGKNHSKAGGDKSPTTSSRATSDESQTATSSPEKDEKSSTKISYRTDIDKSSGTLLVLFTTFDERGRNPHKILAHRHIIRNWSHFIPTIQPVLFVTGNGNSSLAIDARRAGWHLALTIECSEYGVPRLKAMYRHVFQNYNSTFYGFSNGDILFEYSLIQTLDAIRRNNLTTSFNDNALVIGRRHNLPMKGNETAEVFVVDRLKEFENTTVLDSEWNVDFFFFTRNGSSMNWTGLIDVVIGRPAYDNYLVAVARHSGVFAIDASATLLALHVSAKDLLVGEGSKNEDAEYNLKMIGTDFRYEDGLTWSAEWETSVTWADGGVGDIYVRHK